jgi:tyrosyl-tRNA synthetase
MIAGVNLIRTKEKKPAFAMTSTLLTNSEGKKMGKTVGGAVWLDPAKTTPYDFYQYWRNVEDADVEKCLSLLTFLPMDEVRKLGSLKDAEINKAKKILAYEVTKSVHGEDEAKKAEKATDALFGTGNDMSDVPTVSITKDMVGASLLDILAYTKIVPSKSEGRRLVQQGGIVVNDEKVTDINAIVSNTDFKDGSFMLKRGKKKFYKITLK